MLSLNEMKNVIYEQARTEKVKTSVQKIVKKEIT